MADVRENPARAGGGEGKFDPRGIRAPTPAIRQTDAAPPRADPAEKPGTRRAAEPSRADSRQQTSVGQFGLTRGDQVFVAVLLGAAVCLMSLHWLSKSDLGRREIEIERLPAARYEYRLDINTATWVEFAQFDGIGETLARRIVEDREHRGPFTSIDNLLRVKGIGPAKLQAMRRHLYLGDAQGADMAKPPAAAARE